MKCLATYRSLYTSQPFQNCWSKAKTRVQINRHASISMNHNSRLTTNKQREREKTKRAPNVRPFKL